MKPIRDLTLEEMELTMYLLSLVPEYKKGIPKKVRTMNDGNMGSVTFDVNGKSELGQVLINVEYKDIDGVDVLIGLTADKSGNLFELDFWKTDFNQLAEYPTPEKLKTAANNV